MSVEEEKRQNSEELNDEYEKYRQSLIFMKECPACHYIQGMLFLGVSFFAAVRMNFLWQSLSNKQIVGYSSVCGIFAALGIYKSSYAYHVFQAQGRIQYKKKI